MLKCNLNYESYYEPETKIWSGGESERYYDRSLSFGQIAFEELRRRPNKICQISDSERTTLTNGQLLLQAIRIAKYFESQNIQQNDIIGIFGRNTTYLTGVLVGCFFHGCAYHALNPAFDKETSKKIFEITKPKLIFCDGQDYEKIVQASSGFQTKVITLSHHMNGITSVCELLNPVKDEHVYRPAKLRDGPEQNMAILCSSGSTATPKAVTIPNTTRIYQHFMFLTEDDVQFAPSTMDWLTGFVCLLFSIVFGTLRIISDAPITPEYTLELFEKYKVTASVHSPPAMALIVKSPKASPKALESMRYFFYGGSKCTVEVQKGMQALLKNDSFLIFAYGFTELYGLASRNSNFREKPNSVGLICPGYKAKVMDAKGMALGPGETGEILIHHKDKWQGYYGNREATLEARDENGWYRTGDLGYFDSDNYLYIVGRLKEMLKFRGIQFYPSDIEEIIGKMPEVKEACVFGIANELIGDAATAAIVPMDGCSLTVEDVIEFVRSATEAQYKHLNGGAFILKELPKTGSGKIDRRATKQIFLDNKNNNNNNNDANSY